MSWQDTLLADVEKVTGKTHKSGPRGVPWVGLLLRIHPDIRAIVRQIGERRNISMNTYLRRLVIMGIHKETGVPLSALLALCPSAQEPGNRHLSRLQSGGGTDDGIGMEGMCTHPGCDEVHV